jgi:hypothetical protein
MSGSIVKAQQQVGSIQTVADLQSVAKIFADSGFLLIAVKHLRPP